MNTKHAGFCIAELTGVIALIAIFTGLGSLVISSVNSASLATRLELQGRMLNSSVAVYLANGGNLDQSATVEDVITKLKTVASRASAPAIAGLRGTMIDARTQYVFQTPAQAATDELRLLWNPADRKFRLATEGGAGIRGVALTSSAAPIVATPGERATALHYATSDTWVWDYTDNPPATATIGLPNGGLGPISGYQNHAGPEQQTLLPPLITPSGEFHEHHEFPLPVQLVERNAPGVSRLLYTLDGNLWSEYSGGSIPVTNGVTVEAISISRLPEEWRDSASSRRTFRAYGYVESGRAESHAVSIQLNAGGSSLLTVPALSRSAVATPESFNSSNQLANISLHAPLMLALSAGEAGLAAGTTFAASDVDGRPGSRQSYAEAVTTNLSVILLPALFTELGRVEAQSITTRATVTGDGEHSSHHSSTTLTNLRVVLLGTEIIHLPELVIEGTEAVAVDSGAVGVRLILNRTAASAPDSDSAWVSVDGVVLELSILGRLQGSIVISHAEAGLEMSRSL